MDRNDYNLLIDYYGDLLTDHQLDILKLYYCEDYTMIEISETLSITKAAVSDVIKRSTSQLIEYEDKLKFIAHDNKILKVLDEMENKEIAINYVDRIKKILKG